MTRVSDMFRRRLLGGQWLRYVLAGLVVGVLAFAAVEANTAYVRDLLIESIYGSKPHRVPCDRWPTPDQARQVTAQHALVVRQIESVNPGGVTLFINARKWKCPGRAGIGSYYQTYRDRDAIRAIIGDDTHFFGVPYTLFNT